MEYIGLDFFKRMTKLQDIVQCIELYQLRKNRNGWSIVNKRMNESWTRDLIELSPQLCCMPFSRWKDEMNKRNDENIIIMIYNEHLSAPGIAHQVVITLMDKKYKE